MTTFTTHYGFAKPDFLSINWHIPVNGTIDNIDTALKNIQDAVDALELETADLQAQIDALDERVTQNELDIKANTEQLAINTPAIEDHETRITANEAAVEYFEENIQAHSASIVHNTANIEGAWDVLNNLHSRLYVRDQEVVVVGSDQNDFNPTNNSTTSVFSLNPSSGDVSITGWVPGYGQKLNTEFTDADGRIIIVYNIDSTNNVFFISDSLLSAADHRFDLPYNVGIAPNECAAFTYSETAKKWYLLFKTSTTSGTFSSATLSSPVTTVAAPVGDVSTLLLDPVGSNMVINGISGGAGAAVLSVVNSPSNSLSGNFITILNDSVTTAAANRVIAPRNWVLKPFDSIKLRYDSTASRWRVIEHGGNGMFHDIEFVGTVYSDGNAGNSSIILPPPGNCVVESVVNDTITSTTMTVKFAAGSGTATPGDSIVAGTSIASNDLIQFEVANTPQTNIRTTALLLRLT